MPNSRPARNRVTISDIAERAGVSIGAVSFALNGRKGVSDQTRDRVQRIAREMGWAPASAARSLAEAKTATVGLVLARDPRTLGIESFYMRFLSGLEEELARRAYSLLLQLVPSNEAAVETLRMWRDSRRVDGVLLTDVVDDDPRIDMFGSDVPAVVVGDPSVADGLHCVWTDDATSMRESVRYLAALGHRRIARVAGPEGLAHTRIRDEAFAVETGTMGLEPVLLRTDYTAQAGAAAIRSALTAPEPPTAIVTDNDIMAVAGLTVAHGLGLRVPDDVSIIAWDDSVLCEHTFPTLTALSHDVISFGANVGRRLFAAIDGEPADAVLDSTPRLIARGSTGPMRRAD
ncbi:LacI family DNA-binding transcriptional regulator [Microbacterium sp. M3]|uniref:LacI family DNA-binding transcriptional regulator n=1 Tax=Microbacterium arthrosphaerae TaxID=792652 RepID=A0ABU4GZH0_9MICO|nr:MULTISPECIES: LacI family DNA-binding transcriptional regulator [Microbacterium]MDW4571912.1 LacI family DNA-binding transcriptional regulator [Microbacterium arthrosphaerae]MDW7605767.1 LacI family DNA-binding transcriptional regulator [Microbacterium sp. M3]